MTDKKPQHTIRQSLIMGGIFFTIFTLIMMAISDRNVINILVNSLIATIIYTTLMHYFFVKKTQQSKQQDNNHD